MRVSGTIIAIEYRAYTAILLFVMFNAFVQFEAVYYELINDFAQVGTNVKGKIVLRIERLKRRKTAFAILQ